MEQATLAKARLLHTMIRVFDLDKSIDFYTRLMGMKLLRKREVPPGRYTLVGWHERVGERTSTVDVQAGRATTVNLSLPVEDSP